MWCDVKNGFFAEKMLWLAVLRRAIFDYVLYKGIGGRSIDWKRANQYIFGDSVSHEYGLNFEEVCALFEWNHSYVRKLTKKLTRSDVRKLESSRFKEEFIFNIMEEIVRQGLRWRSVDSSVPFFPPERYCEDYRKLVTLRPVAYEREPIANFIPSIHWVHVA